MNEHCGTRRVDLTPHCQWIVLHTLRTDRGRRLLVLGQPGNALANVTFKRLVHDLVAVALISRLPEQALDQCLGKGAVAPGRAFQRVLAAGGRGDQFNRTGNFLGERIENGI